MAVDRLVRTLLVPAGGDGAVALGARIAVAWGGYLLTAAIAAPGSEAAHAEARELARAEADRAASIGAEPEAVVRVDESRSGGMEAIADERDVSLVLASWDVDAALAAGAAAAVAVRPGRAAVMDAEGALVAAVRAA